MIITLIAGFYSFHRPEPELTDEQWRQDLNSLERLADQQKYEEVALSLTRLARQKRIPQRLILRLTRLSININDAKSAAKFLDQATDPTSTPQRLFLQGIVALINNRAADAERCWTEAVKLNSGFGPAWERLAQLYLSQIRGIEARNALEGLQNCRPLSIEELSAYSSANEPFYSAAERLAMVERYSREDPTDTESFTATARYMLLEDRFDDVLEWLRKRELRANDVRFAVDACLRLGNLAEAERIVEPWKGLESPPFPIARARGLLASSKSNWSEAAWFLRLVASHEPSDTPVIYQLGKVLDRLGKNELAATALKLAAKNEDLNNLIHRIRRTTHLPVRVLAPLILDACLMMIELGREREAHAWLQLLVREGLNSPRISELEATLSKVPPEVGSSAEMRLLSAATIDRPTDDSLIGKPSVSLQSSSEQPLLASQPQFKDVHETAGVDFSFEVGGIGQKWILETLGGGVAAFDYDNDGWVDLYFPQGGKLEGRHGATFPATEGASTLAKGKLFRNLGNGRFSDVTIASGIAGSGYGQGCSAGDFDNDGDADLFVATFGANLLYQNNGDGTFTNISSTAGVVGDRWHTSVAFCDLNLDGNLDIYITTYVRDAYKICRKPDGTFTICSPANYAAEDDLLLLNQGNGTFNDISELAGIKLPQGKGLGVIVADFTGDRRPDVYVANDGTPNFLFRNDGNDLEGICHFTDIGMPSGCAVSGQGMAQAGMGIACDDFDGNGWLDLVVTNFFNEGSTFYLNQGGGYFEDLTAPSGLLTATKRLLGFGIQSIDYSLSGAPGLFIANGHIGDFGERNEPWKMPPQVFSSDRRGHFQEKSNDAGSFFQKASLGRAVARLDFDRDNRPDLAITYLDRPAALLRNETEPHGNSIVLKLVGTVSNRDGRGCRAETRIGSNRRIFELVGGDGFMCCNERSLVIGIGDSARIDDFRLIWPSGTISLMGAIDANTAIIVIEDGSCLVEPSLGSE